MSPQVGPQACGRDAEDPRALAQVVRPSPSAHRVLDARRRGPHRRRRRHGGGRRPTRGRHHRPREHVRRPRLLPRRARRRRHAGHRHRGVHGHHEPATTARAATSTTSTTSRCSRESTQGYRNLIKVSSHAYLDGFYHKPARRLRAARAAPRGPRRHDGLPRRRGVPGAARRRLRRRARARRRASRTSSGATRSSSSCRTTASPSSTQVNPQLIAHRARARARRCSPPTTATTRTATTPSRTPRCCACRPGRTLDDPNRFKFDADEFYLKTAAEMRHLFRDYEEACDNTLLDRRARRRRDRVRQRGAAGVPDARRATTRTRTSASSRSRAPRSATASRPRAEVLERLEYELGVIKTMGFSAYFLVVWDLVPLRARRAASASGPGGGARRARASRTACASSTSTPSRYDLLFERFLNPGRKQMPDIDMDFDSRYRGEMIQYAARALRRGPRRADRHVLHDQGAGRGARLPRACSATRTSSATRSPSSCRR